MSNEASINVSVSSHYREASCASEVTSQGILGQQVPVPEPGDLLFFGTAKENVTHVEISPGNLRFIDAGGWFRYNSFLHSEPDLSPQHPGRFISVNRRHLNYGAP